MTRHDLLLLSGALLLSLAALAGCTPKIGDACTTSTDCSATGGRLCDTTEPGGYCTIFNCEPGSCPSEAHCVAFKDQISQAAACQNPQGSARLERTFCMAKCSKDSDCRSGYKCVDMNAPDNAYGAVVIDKGNVNGHVCAVPVSGAPVSADADTAVCTGEDDGGYGSFEAGPDAGSDAEAGSDAAPDAGEAGVDASTDAAGDAAQSDASDAMAD